MSGELFVFMVLEVVYRKLAEGTRASWTEASRRQGFARRTVTGSSAMRCRVNKIIDI